MKRARQGDEALEDVKTFFEFAIKVVVFRHEVMHVEKVRISHVSDELGGHTFRRIFDVLFSKFR